MSVTVKDRFPDLSGSPLFRAIEKGDNALVGRLLDDGEDPNERLECTVRWGCWWFGFRSRVDGQFEFRTPLMLAVLMGSMPICELLIAKGADVSAVNNRPMYTSRSRADVYHSE